MLWAFLAGVVTFGISLMINRLGLLGMGDVKLMTVMALALGWFSPLLPIIALGITFLIAGVVALWLLMRRKLKLGESMPLGPFLVAGFLAATTLAVWS
jgi:leader peptidase (prepilin peptidase)/N-methyltransferase